jgi:thiamine monophosphate kinase
LANETKIVGDDAALLVARDAQVATLDTLVSGLNTKSVLDAKVCTDQIAVVKAEARKSKLKWFAAGFVSGLTLGIWKF